MMRKPVPRGVRRSAIPAEFDGPLDVKREINYSQKMFDALEKRREETGIAITEQVRRAIVRDLVSDDEFAMPDSITPENIVAVELEPERFQRLKDLGAKLGHKEVAHFIEFLAERALVTRPQALRDYLYSGFFEEEPNPLTAGDDEAVEADRQLRKQRKAANDKAA